MKTLKKVENYYKNGQLFERFFVDENGKQQGLYEICYDNGQQYVKATYKDNKRHGLFEKWYSNGQLEKKSTYKDGKLNGLYEEWYINGQQRIKATYKNGKLIKNEE